MSSIDITTIINAYLQVLGDPALVGVFGLVVFGIFAMRMGATDVFLIVSSMCLVYIASAWLPVGLVFIAYLVGGVIIGMGILWLISRV